MDIGLRHRIIELRERIVANFTAENWGDVGVLTQQAEVIDNHDRLLRSLSWGDEDYSGNVLEVLQSIAERDVRAISVIESYVDKRYPGEAHFISAKPAERRITFAPHVFQVPDGYMELDLVAVMMPFSRDFDSVYEAIRNACKTNNLRCLRADDIWEETTIVQDIFNLIFRAQVIVVDFTGKNANVMYETGIAHTLGKHVVPIAQSMADVPFDMAHHRALTYLRNNEGINALENGLAKKLRQFGITSMELPEARPAKQGAREDDDIPF
jgi:hypothetical protein